MMTTAKIPSHVPNESITHSVPVGDLREHDTASRGMCWCRPRIEEAGFGYAVMHNSMDGRELYERGERRPS